MRRTLIGTTAALAILAALTAAMVPVRSHLSIATTALVLVVPVVVGVVGGAFPAGLLSLAAGFLVYDFVFIPPYGTLTVGASQNWVALAVYAVVMVLVARVVASLDAARSEARRQGREIRELFELSDLLLGDKPLDRLLGAITTSLRDVFGCRQVALLLPRDGALRVVAATGEPLTDEQYRRVVPVAGTPASLRAPSERGGLLVLALAAAGRPIGLLALSPAATAGHEREALLLFANHVALAVERAQLRDDALQSRLAGEVSRLAKTLVGAVAHDLRTPLSSIKASSSTLADPDLDLDPQSATTLAGLIDAQADRLAELVQNLLDMSRIQAGVLEPRYAVASLADLVTTVVEDVAADRHGHRIDVDVPGDLPPVDADLVLVARVLTNLLENALRHSPRGGPVAVRARRAGREVVEVSVSDHGPGVPPARRQEIFEVFARRAGDTGAGLGLTIAKTFVEAHHQHIWVEDAPGGGARFCFTLAVAATLTEEPTLAARSGH